MPISRTQRWLDLIAFLVRHQTPVDVDQVMDAVPAYREAWASGDDRRRATVRRMFERDKDELRAAGIPLRTVEFTIDHGAATVHGYQLASRDFYLPYLRLVGAARPADRPASGVGTLEITGDEAWTAIEALRRVAHIPGSPLADEARAALRKLAFDLDLDALGDSPVRFARAPAPAGAGDDARLRPLHDALRARKRVRFTYHGIHRGQATDRDVAPYGLLYQHGHWYLVGHDATRDAVRVFRVGRMDPPTVAPGDGPDYDVPAGFSMAEYAGREPWELGDDEPVAALVRFDFPVALWADRNRRGDPVDELPGGAQVRRFRVRQLDPFLRWLQSFAGDAIVIDPPALADAQRRMAADTRALYQPDDADA